MANNFNIRIEGLDTALNRLGKLAQQNQTLAKQAINETAVNIERKAKQNLTNVDVPQGFEDFAMQFIGAGVRQVNIKPMPYFHPAVNSELANLKAKLQRSLRP